MCRGSANIGDRHDKESIGLQQRTGQTVAIVPVQRRIVRRHAQRIDNTRINATYVLIIQSSARWAQILLIGMLPALKSRSWGQHSIRA